MAWVSERKDVLCAFFFLLSLLFHASFAERAPETGRRALRDAAGPYALSLACFALALLSKPMAVSLPAVLLILDAFPFGRIRSRRSAAGALVEKIPFLLLAAGSSIVTVLAQRAGGALSWTEAIPLSTRLLVAAGSVAGYLGKLLFPLHLLPYYPYPAGVSLSSPRYFVPASAVLALGLAAAICARKRPMWAAAGAYYLVTLLPVIGIVQVGSQAMADRYTYLPSLGPFVVAGIGVAWGTGALSGAARRRLAGLAMAGLVAAGALSYLTIAQIGVWRTSFTLWDEVIRREPARVPFAYNNRGLAYLGKNDFDRAIADYSLAIELSPRYWAAYFNRGVALLESGRVDRAIEDFDRGLRLRPLYKIYYLRGMAFDRKGNLDAAREDYSRAISLEPSFVDPYVSLGVLHGRAGSFDRAMELFNRAIAIDPNHPLAYGNRGFAYGQKGEHEKALRDLDWAIRLDPADAKLLFNRGGLHLKAGEQPRALVDFRRACELGDTRGCEVAARIAGASTP